MYGYDFNFVVSMKDNVIFLELYFEYYFVIYFWKYCLLIMIVFGIVGNIFCIVILFCKNFC